MLIGIGSVKGSPGATTVAVALAARWPGRALLVEADPAGGDLAMRFELGRNPGLVSLAADARRTDRVDPVQQLWRHAQPLPPPFAGSVIAAPPDAYQACAAIAALSVDGGPSVLRAAADRPGVVVVVDCGRVDPGSPAAAVVRGADAMVLLARPHADELAHLVRRLPEFAQWARCPVLVVTGPGHPSDEVAREMGVAVLARLPHDPAGAEVLAGRRSAGPIRGRRPGPERSVLGHAAGRLAASLIELTATDARAATSITSRGGLATGAPPSTGAAVTAPVGPSATAGAQHTGTGRSGSAAW